MILGYPLIAVSKILKKWKVVITSVGQEYKSTEERQDYKTGTWTTYGRGTLIDIRKIKVFQLQYIWTHDKILQKTKERMRY